MNETKKCRYCAETIRYEAIRCRFCRSRLTVFTPAQWRRDFPERRIAGVCAALAHAFALPLGLVRIGFVFLSFFHLFGVLAYAALWMLIPRAGGEESVLENGLQRLLRAVQAPHDDVDAGPAHRNDA